MARAGLGSHWSCLFANDIDPKKAAAYADNWGSRELQVCDVADLCADTLPGKAELAWASFPCQDLSLAGVGAGLRGERSSTFWPFWSLIQKLAAQGRAPSVVVLENVCGALTSHGGKDFAAIGDAIAGTGYRFGALIIDAARFVPQSRPRLFVVAVRDDLTVPVSLKSDDAEAGPRRDALIKAHAALRPHARDKWIWWRLPLPGRRPAPLSDLVEDEPSGVRWHSPEDTGRLLSMMTPVNLDKVRKVQALRRKIVGCVYRRTRPDGKGGKTQRAEVRFDDVAGCLRTPAGGSSRQTILIVEGDTIRSRLLSPREAARLMGLPDEYRLPQRYNDAYHLLGDGVAVPVVRHLAAHILEPVLEAKEIKTGEAA